MTFDDICETFEEMDISGDTPIRILCDGVEFYLEAITTDQQDGTVVFELEEA